MSKMTNKTYFYLISCFICFISCTQKQKQDQGQQEQKQEFPSYEEIIHIIHKVNDYWQENHPVPENSFWHRAAYHTGNMEAYFLTEKPEYLAYSKAWAEHNEWKGAQSGNREEWKYSYGETDEYVRFGDFQTCFQVYADLYNLEPADYKIARAREVMEYQMGTPQNDYWWWAD